MSAVPGVDVHEARALVGDGAVLLDVREHHEWDAGRAPEAVHLPLGQVEANLGQVTRSRRVVVTCRSGRRSAVAVGLLRAAGIDALNLDGGMQAWHAAGAPVVADAGVAPAVI